MVRLCRAFSVLSAVGICCVTNTPSNSSNCEAAPPHGPLYAARIGVKILLREYTEPLLRRFHLDPDSTRSCLNINFRYLANRSTMAVVETPVVEAHVRSRRISSALGSNAYSYPNR